MLKNFIKVAFRILLRNKVFSVINILGLYIGITASLLILNYVNFEESFDKFNKDYDRIFRLRYERTSNNGESVKFASCCPPAAPIIRQEFPEVEKIGRIFKSRAAVSYGNKSFLETRIFYAEPEVLEILNYNFIEGNPLKDLNERSKAFISESYARKYFGDENPIGKKLSVDKNTDYDIAGIFKDVQSNSHLKFDILLSFKNLDTKYDPERLNSWGETGFFTYLRLKPGYDLNLLKKKIADLVEREAGELFRYYDLKAELPLQPLTDIHLNSNFMQEYETNGDIGVLKILFFIAILILIIAWVNYINLSTAQSLGRAKEIGLRKVIGATKKNLIVQLFTEVITINLIAVILSFFFIFISLPLLNKITGMTNEFYIFSQLWFLPTLSIIILFGILLSGSIPVLIISSFKIVDSLKGKIGQKPGGVGLRKYLVIAQFIVAIVLLTATFTVFRQINFMKNQNLGFEKENVLVFQQPRIRDESIGEKMQTFKHQLLQNNIVTKISCATEVPGRQVLWDAGGIHRAGADKGESRNYQIVGIDDDFIPLFNLELLAGRNFSKEFITDKMGLILNQTAVKWMGFKDATSAIGQKVNYWEEIFTIVGVIKDYHQESPKLEIEPHIYRYLPHGRSSLGVFASKVNQGNFQNSLQAIKENFTAFFPGNPFEYFFLDEYYNQQYEPDLKFGEIVQLFTGLAIFITVIGLFGIALYTTGRRTKEIGVRKVLGSSVAGIVFLLSKEFIKWIVIANVIAWPIASYFLSKWLSGFAYRIDIGIWVFILSGFLALFIALASVSYQSLKAALANPVDSLRYE